MSPRWVRINAMGTPPKPRHGHRAVAIKELIVIFGGGNGGILDELYVFNTEKNHWFTPAVKGEIPSGRAAYGIALDKSRIIIHGGMLEYGEKTNDVFELQASRWEWRRLNPRPPRDFKPSPLPRFGHSFTLIESKIYVFGGIAMDSNCIGPSDKSLEYPRHLNDLYTLDLYPDGYTAWDIPFTFGKPPSPRESHSSVTYRDLNGHYKLFIYGGMANTMDRLGDLWTLDISSMTWRQVETTGLQPLPRSLHTANIVNDKMYIFGGWVPLTIGETKVTTFEKEWKVTNQLACLDLRSFEWNILSNNSPEEMPKARAGHCAVTVNGRIYVWSGRDGYRKAWNNQVCCSDFWYLEINNPPKVKRPLLTKGETQKLELNWAAAESADLYLLQIYKCDPTSRIGSVTNNFIRPNATRKDSSEITFKEEHKKSDGPQIGTTSPSYVSTPDLSLSQSSSPPLLQSSNMNIKQEILTPLQKTSVSQSLPQVLLTAKKGITFAVPKTFYTQSGNSNASIRPVVPIRQFVKLSSANIKDLKSSQVLRPFNFFSKNIVNLGQSEGTKTYSTFKKPGIQLVPLRNENQIKLVSSSCDKKEADNNANLIQLQPAGSYSRDIIKCIPALECESLVPVPCKSSANEDHCAPKASVEFSRTVPIGTFPNLSKCKDANGGQRTVSNTLSDRSFLMPSSIKIKKTGNNCALISWSPSSVSENYIVRYSVVLRVKKEVHPSGRKEIYSGPNTEVFIPESTLNEAEVDMSKGVPTLLLSILAIDKDGPCPPVSIHWVQNPPKRSSDLDIK